jgi:hypothetical protein
LPGEPTSEPSEKTLPSTLGIHKVYFLMSIGIVMDFDTLVKWAGIGCFVLALLTALKYFWPEIKSFHMASWSSRLFFIFLCLGVIFYGIYYGSILSRQPKLELFLLDGRRLDGGRISVNMRKGGDEYVFNLGPFEMKEIGCHMETKLLAIRLFFGPVGIVVESMTPESSDEKEFKTALRFDSLEPHRLPIGACDRRSISFGRIYFKGVPPRELEAAVKIHYGPPIPAVAKFTLLLQEAP